MTVPRTISPVERRASGLVVLLGWDWWDGLTALEDESDEVLTAYLDIMMAPEKPDDPEPEWMRARTRHGIRWANSILRERAVEMARWADDGGPQEAVCRIA